MLSSEGVSKSGTAHEVFRDEEERAINSKTGLQHLGFVVEDIHALVNSLPPELARLTNKRPVQRDMAEYRVFDPDFQRHRPRPAHGLRGGFRALGECQRQRPEHRRTDDRLAGGRPTRAFWLSRQLTQRGGGRRRGQYFDHLRHPDAGPYWQEMDLATRYGDVDVPMLHFAGWFDFFLGGTLRAFQGIQAHARSEATRSAQRLVIGPWIHGPAGAAQRQAGEVDYGPDAIFDLHADRLRWYDFWLKGMANGAMDGAPVRAFLMGANRWIGLSSWPPAGVTYRPLFFRQATAPNAPPMHGGGLSFEAPDATEAPDTFSYDPRQPVPSLVLYPQLGPSDHRPIEDRVLTYSSDVLKDDLTVAGPVTAVLFAASSALDTDWVVRLCDVWPDGRSLSVCDGILRARYLPILPSVGL